MLSGPPTNSFLGPPKELSAASVESSTPAVNNNVSIWQPNKQSSIPSALDQELTDKQGTPTLLPSLANQQFVPNSVPTRAFSRKMQIGSGVPYSPLSPLNILTVIPSSNVSSSKLFLRKYQSFSKRLERLTLLKDP
ncbi:hypothetical protein CRYUN_Cryun26dG0000700 [Craigia yunnanensis]